MYFQIIIKSRGLSRCVVSYRLVPLAMFSQPEGLYRLVTVVSYLVRITLTCPLLLPTWLNRANITYGQSLHLGFLSYSQVFRYKFSSTFNNPCCNTNIV